MANCGKCGKDVGCACHLVVGKCLTCYSQENPEGERVSAKKSTKRVKYEKPATNPPPNNQFVEILHTTGLSREEKLKRINDILENARKQIK